MTLTACAVRPDGFLSFKRSAFKKSVGI